MLTADDITSRDREASVRAYRRLLRAHAAAVRCLSGGLLEAHGLSISGYEALQALSREHGGYMRRVDLARSLGLTPSGITRLLEGLEAAGLVERAACPSDLRVTYARLTEVGAGILAEASRDHEEAIAALLEQSLTEAEIDELGELLGRLPGVECG